MQDKAGRMKFYSGSWIYREQANSTAGKRKGKVNGRLNKD